MAIASTEQVREQQTLPKAEILRGHNGFKEVLLTGSVLRGTLIQGYLLPVDKKFNERIPIRIGFAVTRRVRSAAARNRVRRLMREAYRRNKMPFVKSAVERGKKFSLVFLFRGDRNPRVEKVKYTEVEGDIQGILQKALALE